jgi:D-tyrosyl-tRNA(Tyr) deacylase
MRAVLQRVRRASVQINEQSYGEIGEGILLFLGIGASDSTTDSQWLAEKVVNLRIFPDQKGRMNRSLLDTGGELLVVSQFTLYGDCRKGRRPGFSEAAAPSLAEPLYRHFIEQVKDHGAPVKTGVFQADMEITLVNNGPVTLLLETP